MKCPNTNLQSADGALCDVWVRPGADHPAAGVLVHLLDDVARDGFSAVVLGRLPLQVAARRGYVRHGEGACVKGKGRRLSDQCLMKGCEILTRAA